MREHLRSIPRMLEWILANKRIGTLHVESTLSSTTISPSPTLVLQGPPSTKMNCGCSRIPASDKNQFQVTDRTLRFAMWASIGGIRIPNNSMSYRRTIIIVCIAPWSGWQYGMKLRTWEHDNHTITSFVVHTHKKGNHSRLSFERVHVRVWVWDCSVHAV